MTKSMITSQEILQRANTLHEQIRSWRRTIHRQPELSFSEVKTATLVSDVLHKLGIEAETGVAKTGVVGHISGGTGPTVGLRADMDALPIQEANGTDYDSEIPGVMHACGHDAHTAILMGAATILKGLADEGRLPGNVRLLFQPSEEAQDEEGKSGSPRMIEAGALANLDAVFGLHIDPRKATGTVGLQAGPIAAAADMFDLTIHGFGGHGAFPHTANDPITLATYVVQAVNQIVGRRINPFAPGVVSICTFHAGAGTARNTIPQKVELSGTIRSMTPEIRQQLHDELRRACAIVEPLGGRFDLKIQWGYPPTVNDPAATRLASSALNELLGQGNVIEVEPFLAAEDFSFMLQEVPGCFLLVGVKHPDWEREYPPHTPIFKIDEDVLPIGTASLAAVALRWMQEIDVR